MYECLTVKFCTSFVGSLCDTYVNVLGVMYRSFSSKQRFVVCLREYANVCVLNDNFRISIVGTSCLFVFAGFDNDSGSVSKGHYVVSLYIRSEI